MKSLSASIIVLAGSVVLVGGSFVRHSQSQQVLQLIGGALGVIGLVVWFKAIDHSED